MFTTHGQSAYTNRSASSSVVRPSCASSVRIVSCGAILASYRCFRSSRPRPSSWMHQSSNADSATDASPGIHAFDVSSTLDADFAALRSITAINSGPPLPGTQCSVSSAT